MCATMRWWWLLRWLSVHLRRVWLLMILGVMSCRHSDRHPLTMQDICGIVIDMNTTAHRLLRSPSPLLPSTWPAAGERVYGRFGDIVETGVVTIREGEGWTGTRLLVAWEDGWRGEYAEGALWSHLCNVLISDDTDDYQDYIDAKIADHEMFLASPGADHLFEGHGE